MMDSKQVEQIEDNTANYCIDGNYHCFDIVECDSVEDTLQCCVCGLTKVESCTFDDDYA